MATSLKKITKMLRRYAMLLISTPYLITSQLKGKPLYLRMFSSDINVFYHTFVEKEYKLPFTLKKITSIIDAGANVGLTSVLFAQKYPDAQIIAVEPEAENFKQLSKNIAKYKKIKAIKRGVWSNDSYLQISNPYNQNWSFITKEVDKNSNYDIEAISIKTLIKTNNIKVIDLLKVDIEGAEKELFSKNLEDWLPYTRYIVIEIHGPDCMKIFKNAMDEYNFEFLHKNGENLYYKNSSSKYNAIES